LHREWRYRWGMVDLKLQVPAVEPVEVDAETSKAIARGVEDADPGRTVSLEEARQLIPKWISKFESQKPH
jgi:predicted transcriptional regulator